MDRRLTSYHIKNELALVSIIYCLLFLIRGNKIKTQKYRIVSTSESFKLMYAQRKKLSTPRYIKT
jgi:hypothetical protein